MSWNNIIPASMLEDYIKYIKENEMNEENTNLVEANLANEQSAVSPALDAAITAELAEGTPVIAVEEQATNTGVA